MSTTEFLHNIHEGHTVLVDAIFELVERELAAA